MILKSIRKKGSVKKLVSLVLVVSVLMCTGLASVASSVVSGLNIKHTQFSLPVPKTTNFTESLSSPLKDLVDSYNITCAIVYTTMDNVDGQYPQYYHIRDYLQQSVALNVNVKMVEGEHIQKVESFNSYDIVILDSSLSKDMDNGKLEPILTKYVGDGGVVLVSNSLYNRLPKELLGAQSFEEIKNLPKEVDSSSKVENDLEGLQELARDFTELYYSFTDIDWYKKQNYGFGLVPSTAKSILSTDKNSLISYNHYGKGVVFFTTNLFPNYFSPSNYTMTGKEDTPAFSSTTATANQLFYSELVEYCAKRKYGYALNRVFGYHGTPSASWQLHYEENTAFENNSMKIFSEIAEKSLQIPSFTLIRNGYWWFSRTETVTYLLGDSLGKGDGYKMDLTENAYSSGKHVSVNNKWLSFSNHEDAGSYFKDYPEYDKRAYPAIVKSKQSELLKMVVGGSDGKLYTVKNLKTVNGKLQTTTPYTTCKDTKGKDITVGSYSAPVLVDMDGDDILDIISGSGTGNILFFKGEEGAVYSPKGTILKTGIKGQTLPTIGDINNDGVLDLVIGSSVGKVLVYTGASNTGSEKMSFGYSSKLTGKLQNVLDGEKSLGKWISPTITDSNKDGLNDIVIGTFDGYLAKVTSERTSKPGLIEFSWDGYIQSDELNYKGNKNVKFGNFAVPVFIDVNNDKIDDLICGQQEYGLAYPIDSPEFPFKTQLQEQVDYAKEKGYYVGMHFYTKEYASEGREAVELELHKKALNSYGVPTDVFGVNQHTWKTSSIGAQQSLLSAYKAGASWQSGFASPGSTWDAPQVASENVLSTPFFLKSEDKATLLILNNSTFPYAKDSWAELTAKYKSPLNIYYHCDFAYKSKELVEDIVGKTSDFMKAHRYNFCTEEQLARASASAIQLSVNTKGSLSLNGSGSLEIASSEPAKYHKLNNKNVHDSLGICIELSEALQTEDIFIDADVWYRDDKTITVSLNRPITLKIGESQKRLSHIEQINSPSEIKVDGADYEIIFREKGMLQVIVSGNFITEDKGWTKDSFGDKTRFTRFGEPCSLKLRLLE